MTAEEYVALCARARAIDDKVINDVPRLSVGMGRLEVDRLGDLRVYAGPMQAFAAKDVRKIIEWLQKVYP